MSEVPVKETAEEEIKELERKLEEKKRELQSKKETAGTDKEILSEVLKEHIETVRASQKTSASSSPDPVIQNYVSIGKKNTDDGDKEELYKEHIRALIEIALTKSIYDAVKEAETISPYLLDELHDHLVDKYYDKLVALGKLDES